MRPIADPAYAVAVCALAAAACLVWWQRLDLSPLPEVTRFRDDAYYCFAWARSLAAGTGPCVTPGVPTSGVQPLWAALMAAGALAFGPTALPALAHALGLALHVAAALVLGVVLRRFGFPAVLGALLWLGNPLLLTEAQNGQETALACLCAVLLLPAARARERWFLLVGGLATLARSDLFVLLPFIALDRHGLSWRAARVPALVLGAYAAINVGLAGHPMQDSAAPVPWLFAQHPTWVDRAWFWLRPCLLGGPWSLVSPLLAGVLVAAAVRRWFGGVLRLLPLLATAAAWAAGAADLEVVWIAALLVALVPRRAVARPGLPLLALLAGWTAVALLHYVVRHYPREYYFAPRAAAEIAALVLLAARLPTLGAALAVLAGALAVHEALEPAPQRPAQQESRIAAVALPALIPPHEPIGSFNAGVLAFLRDGPVVNLDGVVNRPAFEALRARDLDGYLDRQHVRFLVDVPVQFALESPWPHASGRWFGSGFDPREDLLELARFDVAAAHASVPGADALSLYWRVGRGPKPLAPSAPQLVGRAPDGAFYVLWPARPGVTLSVASDAGVHTLLRGDAPVAVVVAVPAPQPGRYTLHEDQREPPILTLERR